MADPGIHDDTAAEFLTHLEKQEAGLLAWGVVDGSFSDDELDQLARRFLDTRQLWGSFPDPDDLIRLIEERGLLFPFREGMKYRYRTRTAETVRLMLRLRQLFPKHAAGGWRSAPQLVADAKFLTRARVFPKRHLTTDQLLAAVGHPKSFRAKVIELLINGRTLADFQERATVRILNELDRGAASGTVICAGTGSGKTLAFYLPALTRIAESLDGTDWVRCLAIYPRNELLKDQFTEAYAQCRKLRPALKDAGRRPIRLGALFGPTPRHANAFESSWPPDAWRRVCGDNPGYICPLLRCPDCESAMIWLDADRMKSVERLQCAKTSCETKIEQDEVVLTRDRMKSSPPDVLFTTTEMLNQRLSDSRFGKLFGVGQPPERKPILMLLDEIHTYSGTSGAQTALLLRRWQHAARCKPHMVGLSATLREAPLFFATLTSLSPAMVEEVVPRPTELEPKGSEYLLALRGNPAAGVSLMSVTLQAAMLLSRVLDPRHQRTSEGLFGSKLFLFTDDLDVTNRLFFNLRDAEGQDSWGNPKKDTPGGSLANLRAGAASEAAARFRDGQSWDLCERIGHLLQPDTHSRIGRTSSQDAGVDADADQIVATASLEVGFNDPAVGAVIQHKAPLDSAAFLQRKGRAGRHPRMRPWTVVSLSDYGRDRAAYQGYDQLFDPELQARELPVGNRHVLRMQAVFAMLDWLGSKLEGDPPGSVWQDVSVPAIARSEYEQDSVRKRQKRLTKFVEEVLSRNERREELVAYLQAALRINEEDMESLLWDSPRPLLLAVVPTLLRRLRTQWRGDFHEHNAPLPDFVPRALFQDLSTPEITVVTPPQEKGDVERLDVMKASQALGEFAPGRVSRRFGIKHRYARHWVEPISLDGETEQRMPLSRFISQRGSEFLGLFEVVEDDGRISSVPCVRSSELRTSAKPVPRHILDSSNSFPVWRTQLVPSVEGIASVLPVATRWSEVTADMRFFTHASNCPIEVRRFAIGCEASIAFEDGKRFEPSIRFTDDKDRAAAVGFAHDADAVVLRLRCDKPLHQMIGANHRLLRSLRTGLFRNRVRKSRELDGVVNVFARDWLALAFLCTAVSHTGAGDLRSALREVPQKQLLAGILSSLDVFFEAMPTDRAEHADNPEATEDAAPGVERQNAHKRLREALENPTVLEALLAAAAVLWEPPDPTWESWLLANLKSSVGAAAVEAIGRLCPDANAREVLVDPEPGPRSGNSPEAPMGLHEVWLTESAVGGGGVLEKFQQRYGEDPRRFFDLLTRALDPGDFETVDMELARFLDCLTNPGENELVSAVAAVRAGHTLSHGELAKNFEDLLGHLRNRNFTVTHPVVAALAGRLLRAGTSERSDRLLSELLSRWQEFESRLGIEIDGRTFAWLASGDDTIGTAITNIVGITHQTRGQRFAAVTGLLWLRGSETWGQSLKVRNPYFELGTPDRELIIAFLPPEPPPIMLNRPDAMDLLREALRTRGVAVLVADAGAAREAVLKFAIDPVDTGSLLAYPRIRSVVRSSEGMLVTLEITEVSP